MLRPEEGTAAQREPDLLERAWTALGAALTAPVGGPGRADLAAGACLLAVAAALIFAPALYIEHMPLDVFIQLDGAWRWASGQRPHVDFYTPVGGLWYVLLGTAHQLDGGDARLVLHASVLLMPFAALAAWVAVRDRLPALPRVLLWASLVLLAVSPRTLDSQLLSGVASYNRYGWGLATIAIAAVLLAPERERPRWPEGVVVAACLVALFFLKITYVGLVLGAVAVCAVAVPANRWAALGGAAAGLAGIGASLGLPSTRAYLADLARTTEAASGAGLLRFERVSKLVEGNLLTLVVVGGLAFALARTASTPEEERDGGRAVLGALLVALGALGVALQSHDAWVPPLLVCVAALFMALRTRGDGLLTRLGGAALCGLLAGALALDAQAVLRVLTPPAAAVPMVARADSPGAGILLPPGDPDRSMVGLVRSGTIPGDVFDNLAGQVWQVENPIILEDALELVERNGLAEARIASLTFSPPFAWLLGSPPPRGLPSWWDWQRTFGPADADRMPQILADSEVVLEPEVWNIEGIHDTARATLEAEFELRDQTALWKLWVRR